MMGLWRGPLPVCPRDQNCSKWAQIYMKYCLCSVRDGASLTVGLISVCSWAVAEIPQIITIYKEKSTEGLSFAFLITWVIGYLVPVDLTVGQFVYVIRKRIKLSAEKVIFIFVDNVLPPTGAIMSTIYDEKKDEDGFLYVTYSGENMFGIQSTSTK